MRTIDAPILLDVLRRTLPEGVSLSVHDHEVQHYEARFIPDPFIIGLQNELDSMEEKDRIEREAKMGTKEAKDAAREKAKLSQLYAMEDEEDDDDY